MSSNRRKSGRLVCVGLVSDLGQVPDLSAGGCRIRCRRMMPFTIGGTYTFTLSGEGTTVVILGKIMRRERLGFMTFEYGVEFVDLTAEQRDAILDLSQTTSVKRVIPTIEEAAYRAAA